MGKAIVILSIALGLVVVLGFIVFSDSLFRKETNQPAEEKETTNFLNNSTSPVVTTKRESVERDRGEVLKKNETADPPGQGVYKSVDEKGTINFSDDPTSSVIATKKGAVKQDGAELLKRNETPNPPGQGAYRSVDEKGTINFSDNPTSSVITTRKGAVKQDGGEELKRNEMASQKANKGATQTAMTDSEIQAKLLTMPTRRGSPTRGRGGRSGTDRGDT